MTTQPATSASGVNTYYNTTPAKKETDGVRVEKPEEKAGERSYSTSVDELKDTFAGYDNSEAVAEARQNIDENFFSIRPVEIDPDELVRGEGTEIELRQLYPESVRERRHKQVTAWMNGEGAFGSMFMMMGSAAPGNFHYRATGETAELLANARQAMFDVAKAGYSEESIATAKEYAKKVAELTPNDFQWMDFSGLQGLTLGERSEFQTGLNEVFQQAGIEADASRVNFRFDQEGRVTSVNGPDLKEETKQKIQELFNYGKGASSSSRSLLSRLRELSKMSGLTDTFNNLNVVYL